MKKGFQQPVERWELEFDKKFEVERTEESHGFVAVDIFRQEPDAEEIKAFISHQKTLSRAEVYISSCL